MPHLVHRRNVVVDEHHLTASVTGQEEEKHVRKSQVEQQNGQVAGTMLSHFSHGPSAGDPFPSFSLDQPTRED